MVLDLNGNNIESAEVTTDLSSGVNLSLIIKDLEQCFACMVRLNELDLRNNPIEKVPKIRDQVFMMSNTLSKLHSSLLPLTPS